MQEQQPEQKQVTYRQLRRFSWTEELRATILSLIATTISLKKRN